MYTTFRTFTISFLDMFALFQGEIIEAVINDQWCDAKITKIIPPTQEEINKDKEEQEDDDVSKVLVKASGSNIYSNRIVLKW